MVERLLAKEEVVGSNPIARSIPPKLAAVPGAEGWERPAGFPVFVWAEVAQLVEHATENCGVPSSSLGLGTILHLSGHSGVV